MKITVFGIVLSAMGFGILNAKNPGFDCSGCIDNTRPSCGADGKTYGSDCLVACAGITVAYLGKCRANCGILTAKKPGFNCSVSVCTDSFRPVCGTDGKTYRNECIAAIKGAPTDDQAWMIQGECKGKRGSKPGTKL